MSEVALVASAFSVIGSAVSTAKTAVELSKLTENRELKEAVDNVLDAVLDAKVKIHDLGDENRSLREKRITTAGKKARRNGWRSLINEGRRPILMLISVSRC